MHEESQERRKEKRPNKRKRHAAQTGRNSIPSGEKKRKVHLSGNRTRAEPRVARQIRKRRLKGGTCSEGTRHSKKEENGTNHNGYITNVRGCKIGVGMRKSEKVGRKRTESYIHSYTQTRTENPNTQKKNNGTRIKPNKNKRQDKKVRKSLESQGGSPQTKMVTLAKKKNIKIYHEVGVTPGTKRTRTSTYLPGSQAE